MNTIIEKIRAEIKGITETARNTRINGTTQQAKEADAIIHALDNLMLKISDLEKECEKPTTAEGLEEEIRSYLMTNRIINHSEMGWKRWGEQIARHFAQWGAEHRGSLEIPNDLEEAAHEAATYHFQDGRSVEDMERYFGFVHGAQWQKEQMMKEAVEGKIAVRSFRDQILSLHISYRDMDKTTLSSLHTGGKVRIIIVKED